MADPNVVGVIGFFLVCGDPIILHDHYRGMIFICLESTWWDQVLVQGDRAFTIKTHTSEFLDSFEVDFC
jgi:hypothetical protein